MGCLVALNYVVEQIFMNCPVALRADPSLSADSMLAQIRSLASKSRAFFSHMSSTTLAASQVVHRVSCRPDSSPAKSRLLKKENRTGFDS
jgi:hypothetical protein